MSGPLVRVTQLDIFKGQLERNRGHNEKAHGFLTYAQTGYTPRCYRCQLLKKIEKESLLRRTVSTWTAG